MSLLRSVTVPVPAEVDAKLTKTAGTQIRLRPDEWTSGEILWLVDLVGDPKGISVALSALMRGALKDQTVKVAVLDAAGVAKIDTLDVLIAAAAVDVAGDLA